ncbi:MAG: acyltransferase [Candidatus Bathyarchaeota archaeon]|nr:acyltransferase [Candidatus Bathyarchaeota archaeon]
MNEMNSSIKKKPASYTKIQPISKRLSENAKAQGYSGPFAAIRYGLVFLRNYYFNLLANFMPYSGLRVIFHRARGVRIGENVLIGQNVLIDNTNPHLVSIGNRVSLAGNNVILTHSRPLVYHKKWFDSYLAPVVIEDDVWITVGVTILAGVRIGRGSVIAAYSLVSKDIPPNCLAAGIPAKVIKKLE